MNVVETARSKQVSQPIAAAVPIPVLFMVRELGLGGIERDVAKLALRIDHKRFLPHVAAYKLGGPRYEELRRAEIPILHLEFPSLLSTKAIAAAYRFRRFIRVHGIRIVHAFDPSSVFGVPLARFLRVPVVLSSQLGHRELHDPRTRKQLRMVDRLSDVVVVNCEALRRHLTDGYSVERQRIELCYNGVETREFYPGPAERPAQLADATLVIGAICVLRAEKRLDLLQAAFARVRHLRPGLKLLIVGNGPELERLQRNSERLLLTDAAVFLPAVASVGPLMRAIDIFVLPSRSEAFSNALLEAMACGCCAVGSRVGGTPELIGEDERGLLFENENVEDLAAKLERLIQDEPLRRTLAERGAQFAKTRLTIEANVDRMMQIYDELLSRKQVRH